MKERRERLTLRVADVLLELEGELGHDGGGKLDRLKEQKSDSPAAARSAMHARILDKLRDMLPQNHREGRKLPKARRS